MLINSLQEVIASISGFDDCLQQAPNYLAQSSIDIKYTQKSILCKDILKAHRAQD